MMYQYLSPDMMLALKRLVGLYHEGVSGCGNRSIEYDVCAIQIQRLIGSTGLV